MSSRVRGFEVVPVGEDAVSRPTVVAIHDVDVTPAHRRGGTARQVCAACLEVLWIPDLHAADPLQWHTSIEKAQAAARESGKLIFALFTGSDAAEPQARSEGRAPSRPC